MEVDVGDYHAVVWMFGAAVQKANKQRPGWMCAMRFAAVSTAVSDQPFHRCQKQRAPLAVTLFSASGRRCSQTLSLGAVRSR